MSKGHTKISGAMVLKPSTDRHHVKIKQISPDETVPLRHTVLWPSHPVSHVLLPEDNQGSHYGASLPHGDHPIAVISVFKEPLPCDPSHQGRDIGTMLLKHVFEIAASDLGCDVIWCDARLATAEWYERRGMSRFGEIFHKGDIPYVRMKGSLSH
ncbi:GCN5-related N-acetyltransferase [Fomitopsis serialis]|uniref:GCN5-related N-acetyltransferase n=1 Tax=Fomitopsis serialis TaxID=139415 RepID=UPI002007C73A|nr:GCN5-related N-acetyltransferase [Neoantrodia serialis]KAH9910478.1 GCN5-related N-acetyltransferase [Neoantrodia serialis]